MRILRRVHRARVSAAVAIAAAARGERIRSIFSEVFGASRMLRAGNIFVKFSKGGPPHDRWVWCDKDMQQIMWADPGRKAKGDLKEEAVIKLPEISAFVQALRHG